MFTMLPYLGFVTLPIAVILLWVGWRGRWINDVPHCRRCGFDLRATWPGGSTCPECGAELDSSKKNARPAVVVGERERRTWAVVAGAIAAALFIAWEVRYLSAWLGASNRAAVVSTTSLVRQAESEDDLAAAAGAIRELVRRLDAGELDDETVAQLVDHALETQGAADAKWLPEWGTFFESAWLDARVSDDQARRYARQLATFDVELQGDMLYQDGLADVMLHLDDVRSSSISAFEIVTMLQCFELDGGEIPIAPREITSDLSASRRVQDLLIGRAPLPAALGVRPTRINVSFRRRSITNSALEMPAVRLDLRSSVWIGTRPAGLPRFVCDEASRRRIMDAIDIDLAAVRHASAASTAERGPVLFGRVGFRQPGMWVPFEFEFVPSLDVPWRVGVSPNYASPTSSSANRFSRLTIGEDVRRLDFRAWPSMRLWNYMFREPDALVWYGPIVIPDVPVAWYDSPSAEGFPYKELSEKWLNQSDRGGHR